MVVFFFFHLSSSTVYSKHDAHLLSCSQSELKCRCELECPGNEELLVPLNLLPEYPGEILWWFKTVFQDELCFSHETD